jgi:tRNA G10  N-methylase Trm11
MMPPKLVQMMINIGQTNGQKSIYDPFCGLGTTLIEAANMGYMNLYGSDLSIDMIRATKKSLADFIATEKTWQERIKAV